MCLAKTRPVKSINRDIKLNRALWTLTEEMAKLKNQAKNLDIHFAD